LAQVCGKPSDSLHSAGRPPFLKTMLRTCAVVFLTLGQVKGQGPGGSKACVNPTCATPPCAAATLGDVGCTTVAGVTQYKHEMLSKGDTIAIGSHIYGPFEAGFTSKQDSIIKNWGCTDPSLVYDSKGGRDIGIAEALVAYKCNIEFPRVVGTTWYGAVGHCGGHTGDYHFHKSFGCLYSESGGHSTVVGDIASYKMYGKWEDYSKNLLPLLDACGAHLGPTPDSASNVYHYHVQDKAPFTVGCHGPSSSGGLVSLAACRALYSTCGDDSSSIEYKAGVSIAYDRFCPCWDATGSNTGNVELPALSTSNISYTATSTPTPTPSPTTSTSATGSVSGVMRDTVGFAAALLAVVQFL